MIAEISERHKQTFDADEGIRNPWEGFTQKTSHPFPTAKNLDVPFSTVLNAALEQSKHVNINYGVLGGSPRVDNTRVPVYMILDAIEFHGTLEGVLESYPQLTVEQVRDAVLFAAAVLECPSGQ
ncbi:MAG TPA: DUF433 domain-containing protein [Terriglobales bacterium]|nr:DUF433 domain-containing protein [Terriglobales bacterium]